jgi:hypothetical protein
VQKLREFDILSAVNAVCTADNVLDAIHIFEKNIEILHEWRILYACDDERGSLKIARRSFGEKGVLSTAMRGRSIIVIDKEFVNSIAPTRYQVGYGIYADSNVASFIRRISYGESKSQNLRNFTVDIRGVLNSKDLSNLNPYYYLWECQRNWNSKTHDACRESLASIIAMCDDDDPLGNGWSERFLSRHRENCELTADKIIKDFLTEALAEETAFRLSAIESMIVRAKIIDGASKKSPARKLVELTKFMCEELLVVMIRELIICSDIFFKGSTGITRKLNSLEAQKDPYAVLQGCVWDVFMLRIMDAMATPKGLPFGDAYVPILISMDGDITSIIEMTELKALAICRKSGKVFPFLDVNLEEWLQDHVGLRRFEELKLLFDQESFEARAINRSVENIKEIAIRDRHRLLPPKPSSGGSDRSRAK